MRRLNVLVVMGPIAQGGAEWQILQLLRRLDRRRFRPVLASIEFGSYLHLTISAGDRHIREQYDALRDVKQYRLVGRGRYDPGHLWELFRVIRTERIDVVHTNLYEGDTWGRAAALIARAPIITHKRGMPYKSRKSYHVLVDWLLNLCSNRIVVVTPAIRSYLRQLQPLPGGKFSVIYPGIDLSVWERASEVEVSSLRRELGIGGRRVIATVGRLRPIKGHVYLLRAMPLVLSACPDARLLIIGHGELDERLRALARDLNVSEAVHFLGSRSHVRELLSIAELIVLPSLSEASPVVLMEAAAVGVPAVASEVGGVPGVLLDGFTGLLVPPAEPVAIASAVIRLLQDESLRASMAAAAVAHARDRFSITRTVQQIEAEYERAALRR